MVSELIEIVDIQLLIALCCEGNTYICIYIYKVELGTLEFSLVTQSCPTLCKPMDCSLPGSSVHGISQAKILKWVAISFSRGSSQPRDQTHISCIGRQILYH